MLAGSAREAPGRRASSPCSPTWGWRSEARRELERIRADGIDARQHGLWLGTLTFVADACAALGDTEARGRRLPRARARTRGTNVQIGHLVACHGSADRYLGMLAATLGDWARAEEHFQAALDLNERLGARTWLAHTLLEHARMLLARRAGNDRERAASPARPGGSAGQELGLASVLAKVSALGTAVTTPAVLPDGLTSREVEILRPRGARPVESRDRERALHQRAHRRQPRSQHPPQDGLCQPHRGRGVRAPARARHAVAEGFTIGRCRST